MPAESTATLSKNLGDTMLVSATDALKPFAVV
jgi:hypothetical protein